MHRIFKGGSSGLYTVLNNGVGIRVLDLLFALQLVKEHLHLNQRYSNEASLIKRFIVLHNKCITNWNC